MQQPDDQSLERDYWARQLRLCNWIGLAVAVLGSVRVLLDWPPAHRVAAVPLAALCVVYLAGQLLPWSRLATNTRVRTLLTLWWLLHVPGLVLYCVYDTVPLAVYPVGTVMLVISASAVFTPRATLLLGAVAVAGYGALSLARPMGDRTYTATMVAFTAIVVGLCVQSSQNRRQQDERRRAVERRAASLLENSSDAVIAVAPGRGVVYASSSVRRVLGYEPSWLTTDRLVPMTHPDSLAGMREWIAALFASPDGSTSRIEARTRRADGTWIHVEVIGTNRLADPDVGAAVLSVRDMTTHKALEEELTRQAFEDSLTALPNRALFRDRVDHAIERNRREGGRVTLLLVDLDEFKFVNDTLGHAAGDELIMTVATRMAKQVRSADTLARLGGDEFAVLVEDIDDLEAAQLAERLLAAIRRPVRLGNRDFVCTASIGVATTKAGEGDPGSSAGELLRDADLAMYAAKTAGRDRYETFDPVMYAEILREAEQRTELERALTRGEFVVHYQPIVDLPSSRLTGVEALVRWDHPQRGLLGPNTFIPLAETTGLIVPLGRWVLEEACDQVARWHREVPGAEDLKVSINLSGRQFQYDGLVDDVASVLQRTGISPERVVLEITESLLMQDTDATVETLGRLKDLGVRLAIDDFGTGYSSLSYLKRFPVDILKIDRSFVDGITTQPEDATLAEAVVQLGRALQLQTVAEGIETDDQWSALRTLGCEYGQGYLFARPAAAGLIESLLRGVDSGTALPTTAERSGTLHGAA